MDPRQPSRRSLIKAAAFIAAGAMSKSVHAEGVREPFFLTRGVVLTPSDIETLDWPARAQQAGLTTIAMHIFPHQIAAFVKTDRGQAFLDACRTRSIQVEHELHAMSDLLPRDLFAKDPTMFRMNEKGQRSPDANLCVNSKNALATVCENAVNYAQILRPTTGRYFYWIDDAQPMCRCEKCRGFSDSDQALILENAVLQALRKIDPRATLAHLSYGRTLKAPTQVKPDRGIFLEFAPIHRQYDRPLSDRAAPGDIPAEDFADRSHGEALDLLDANLAVFGSEGAQALEYWLDMSRAARWNRKNLRELPWHENVFLDDLKTYAQRGVRHITSFAVWLDGEYVKRFGDPPLNSYGAGMHRWQLAGGKAVEKSK